MTMPMPPKRLMQNSHLLHEAVPNKASAAVPAQQNAFIQIYFALTPQNTELCCGVRFSGAVLQSLPILFTT